MSSHDNMKQYISTICREIRWKKAHDRVAAEIENHIADGRDAYMAQGMEEQAATEKAIADTGDGTVIGTQLDRIHRPKPQWSMFMTTAVLLAIGLAIRMFVFNDSDRVGLLSVRLLWMGIGIAGMILAYFADFTLIGKYPKTVYFCILAMAEGIILLSSRVNGRYPYATYITLLFPTAIAAIIFGARNKGYKGMLQCMLAFLIPCYITLDVPTISGLLCLMITGGVLMAIAGYKEWFGIKRRHGFLAMLVPVVLGMGAFLSAMDGYRWERLSVILNPYLDPHNSGYIGVMARELLKGSIFLGRGNIPDELIPVLTEQQSFPYIDTGLLLAALSALVGWFAFAMIAGVLAFFIIKGLIRCLKQKSSLGLFVSLAIMMTLSMEAMTSILYNLGFILSTPISLPLISHGNMAMVINLVLIGIMLSVFRTGDAIRDKKLAPGSLPRRGLSVIWRDGRLVIDFRGRTTTL